MLWNPQALIFVLIKKACDSLNVCEPFPSCLCTLPRDFLSSAESGVGMPRTRCVTAFRSPRTFASLSGVACEMSRVLRAAGVAVADSC